MKIGMRLRVLSTLVAAGALMLVGGPAMAAPPTAAAQAYTCAGGAIPSGNYRSLMITGACDVPAGATITVIHNVIVAPGAMFDAQSAPSTITIGGNVVGGSGSLVGLGCQPPDYTGNSAHQCGVDPDGHSTIVVAGNVTVTDAVAAMLNGTKIGGNVTLVGGGSDIPWSIKNNVIEGNLTVSGQSVEWLGVLFNQISRNVILTDIAVNDVHPGAPGVYIVRNTVGRNLICMNLTPGVSGGFVPGSVNTVGRNAIGQCAALV